MSLVILILIFGCTWKYIVRMIICLSKNGNKIGKYIDNNMNTHTVQPL